MTRIKKKKSILKRKGPFYLCIHVMILGIFTANLSCRTTEVSGKKRNLILTEKQKLHKFNTYSADLTYIYMHSKEQISLSDWIAHPNPRALQLRGRLSFSNRPISTSNSLPNRFSRRQSSGTMALLPLASYRGVFFSCCHSCE